MNVIKNGLSILRCFLKFRNKILWKEILLSEVKIIIQIFTQPFKRRRV